MDQMFIFLRILMCWATLWFFWGGGSESKHPNKQQQFNSSDVWVGSNVSLMSESDPPAPSLRADSVWAAQPSVVWPPILHSSVGPGRDKDLIRPITLLLKSRWAVWRRAAGTEPTRYPLLKRLIIKQSFLLLALTPTPNPEHLYGAATVRE